VARIALGHRRTGLCPTFSLPTLQRDGYLLRVPLVGGLLDLSQVECLAEVAGQSTNAIVELTNRGNLQLRGLARGALPAALETCRAVGLGDADASLATISPFAAPAEHRVRATLVRDLANLDLERLSRKFVVHVDDAEGTTADRSADLGIRLVEGRYETTVRALGSTTCGAEAEAARLARRLAELCIQHGPHSRAPDVAATEGPEALAAALGATHAWLPSKPKRRSPPPTVGVTMLPRPQTAPPSSRGGLADANHVALAAARFGRVNAVTLSAIGDLLSRH
jgi:precorrin-3B synthase